MSTTLLRSYAVEDAQIDGRTLDVRCVPYGVVAVVRERRDDGTWTPPYQEAWERGAFRHVSRAANRVPLVVGRTRSEVIRSRTSDAASTSTNERTGCTVRSLSTRRRSASTRWPRSCLDSGGASRSAPRLDVTETKAIRSEAEHAGAHWRISITCC